MHDRGRRRTRRRGLAGLVTAAVLVLAVAGTGAGYLMLRTHGSPQQTARAYLLGWQRADYPAMDKVSVHVPPSGLAGPLKQARAQLGMRAIHTTLRRVSVTGSTAQAGFTAAATLASGHTWTYQGHLNLVKRDRHWWVNWSPSAIYPALKAGERFELRAVWPARGSILAANGTVLNSPAVISQSGSVSLLTGNLVKATTAQAKALGAPYRAGDLIGQGGIEHAYQSQLAGRPALSIKIVGPGDRVDATPAHFSGTPGTPVHTSIDLQVQFAASHAVASAATKKPVDLVALQPSTGKVLAVVERPGGYDRALQGVFPPGSTFKVVTASALANAGMRPLSTVQCPATVTIDGRTFHNYDNEHFGRTTLLNAFAVSCNTTFAKLATDRLDGSSLASMARQFGFNAKPDLGIPAKLGAFTTPSQPVDLAADAFGQGTDLVNPLSQAAVAGAIANGTWRPPLLVTSPAPDQSAQPHQLSSAILTTVRPMMRAVVTSGTAAGVGFPPGVSGKTGTAEYGSGPHPPSHAWFIGYRGDLAFAVLVEGGGTGADQAGPIANAFLRALPG